MFTSAISRLVILLSYRPSGARAPWRSRYRGLIFVPVLCATIVSGFVSSPPARTKAPIPALLMGAAGPVQPPTAALQPIGQSSDGARNLGVIQPLAADSPPSIVSGSSPVTVTGTLPPAVDLSADSPPVANQGDVNSCVSWVTGYYLRGWYARRDGYYPSGGPDGAGGFAPMYLFSQATKGHDAGTTFNSNLDLMVSQGIDTRADYTQGDTDYATQPTAAEQAGAAAYKIAGYTTLFVGPNQGPSAQQAIEASLSGGNPVALGLPVYDNFWNADATHYYIDVSNLGTDHGNHAVFASKYDANGLWVENQWGTGWGLNGWVELSWAFVNQYVWQAVSIQPAAPPAGNVLPAMSTPAPSTATSTSVPPVVTSTPAVTDTPVLSGAVSVTPVSSAPAGTPTPVSTTFTPDGSATPTGPSRNDPAATPVDATATPPDGTIVVAVVPSAKPSTASSLPRAEAWWRRWLLHRWVYHSGYHPGSAHGPRRSLQTAHVGGIRSLKKALRPRHEQTARRATYRRTTWRWRDRL